MKYLITALLVAILGTGAFAATSLVELENGSTILTDENSMTLYTFDVDQPGVSNCHGRCLAVWPAALVEETDKLVAPLGFIERADGTLQLTYNDMPLYTFVGDQKVGDINGDNLQGVWHIVELSQ
jgi:predicted lipoprotein with Yx(FWY)xxD motif